MYIPPAQSVDAAQSAANEPLPVVAIGFVAKTRLAAATSPKLPVWSSPSPVIGVAQSSEAIPSPPKARIADTALRFSMIAAPSAA